MGAVRAIRRIGRRGLTTVARSHLGARALAIALEDPEVLRVTLNRLSDDIAAQGFVNEALPRELDRIEGFEDCVWLLSSNVLNHYAARLMVGEASHLYSMVRRHEGTPRVVEIGRYRGGTALLLAAAGGNVLSIDVNEQLRESDQSLRSALSRIGLEGRVEVVFADSTTYPVETGAIDIVFVDGDHRYEAVSRDVAHWVPALRRGGILLLHDAKWLEPSRPWNRPPDAAVLGVHRLVEELRRRSDLDEMTAPGTLVQFRYTGDQHVAAHVCT
jgi:predicted O-methyltransferase YrrM